MLRVVDLRNNLKQKRIRTSQKIGRLKQTLSSVSNVLSDVGSSRTVGEFGHVSQQEKIAGQVATHGEVLSIASEQCSQLDCLVTASVHVYRTRVCLFFWLLFAKK